MEAWTALLPVALIGLLLTALALPLAMRRVPPNPWYGFRVARTMRRRAVWYESNAYGGRLMAWLGVLTIVTAAALPMAWDASPERLALAGVLAMTAGSFVVIGLWYRHLLTLDEPPASEPSPAPGADPAHRPDGLPDLPVELPPLKLTGIAFALVGVVLMAAAIPLVQRSVPPNGTYGFRTAETLRNARVWYEANAYSGWTMIGAGGVIFAASIGLAASWRVSQKAYVPLMLAVLIGSLGVSLALSYHHLGRII